MHLVDARELQPYFGSIANAQVRTFIEGNRDTTKGTVESNSPVWNEVMTFDIERGDDTLRVQIVDIEPDTGRAGRER